MTSEELLLQMALGYLADGRAMLKEAVRLNFISEAVSYPEPGGAAPPPKVVVVRAFRDARVAKLLEKAEHQHRLAMACIDGITAIQGRAASGQAQEA